MRGRYDRGGYVLKEKLRYRINPCDYARFKILAPIGDAIAAVWKIFTIGTDCPCCLGTRLILLVALAAAAGAFFA